MEFVVLVCRLKSTHVVYKNSVFILHTALCVSIIKTNLWMLYKRNKLCLVLELYIIHKHTVWTKGRVVSAKPGVKKFVSMKCLWVVTHKTQGKGNGRTQLSFLYLCVTSAPSTMCDSFYQYQSLLWRVAFVTCSLRLLEHTVQKTFPFSAAYRFYAPMLSKFVSF